MTERSPGGIPPASHPDPVLQYVVEDGRPLVAATTDSFDAAFDGVDAGTPVAAIFDRFGVVEPTGDAEPATHVARGDSDGVYLDEFGDGGPYFARIVAGDAPNDGDAADAADAADAGGHLVFVDLSDCLGVAETAGIGQVASVVSHDLRNPLDVAGAHLRAARETGDPEHFDAVADAHDRMTRIIRDVLTLARGDGAVDPSATVPIEAAVEDAWRSVDTDDATLERPGALPTATADPDRVRRLFENLFRNAVEHGAAAGRPVTVTVGALDGAGFYVADDGPGVPADEREAVFDPGYTGRDGGTGLGLAIVAQIVAAHDWEIDLVASRDGGARFEVLF